MIKIVMLARQYWHPPGGPSLHVKNLVSRLAKNKEIELHLVTFGSETKLYSKNGLLVHELKRRFCAPFNIPIEVLLLKREILRIDPDIVHVQGTYFPYSTVTALIGRRYVTVMTVHGLHREEIRFRKGYESPIRYFFEKFISVPLEHLAISRIPHIISVSPFVSKYLRFFSNSNIYNISNGVNKDLFDIKPISNLDQLLFVGHVTPRKGLFDLIRLVKKLVREKGLDIKLNIVGPIESETYLKHIKSHIESNNLTSYIQLTGFVSYKELIQKYRECTIFVFPTRFETYGMVLLEAFACGKPVVASNVGGIPYIVEDGKTGFLFECGNVDELTEKVVTLIENAELRRKMGEEGRRKAKEFTWERIAERTFSLYKKISTRP